MNKDAAKLREISEYRGRASAATVRRAKYGSRAAIPVLEVRLTLPMRVGDPRILHDLGSIDQSLPRHYVLRVAVEIGDVLLSVNHWDAALRHFQTSLALFPDIAGSGDEPYRLGISDLREGMGDALAAVNRFEEALAAFESSIVVRQRLRDAIAERGETTVVEGLQLRIARLHIKMGEQHRAAGRMPGATRSFQRASRSGKL